MASYYHLSAAQGHQQPQPSPPQPPVPISITICGDGGCGKSSITLRLVRSQWTSEYDPTVEDNYSVTRRVDGVTYHLSLTDTAGQEEYRGMWASSGLRADAFLLVYDITSRESLDALQYFNDLIDMEAEARLDNAARLRRRHHQHEVGGTKKRRSSGSSQALRDGNEKTCRGSSGSSGDGIDDDEEHDGWARTVPPVKMVAANKCDLQEGRRVPASMGLDWARRRGCGFMETSARLEVNVEETFALLVRRVAEQRRLAALGVIGVNTDMSARGMTKPLTPPPTQQQQQRDLASSGADAAAGEKRHHALLSWADRERWRRGVGGLWRWLRCW